MRIWIIAAAAAAAAVACSPTPARAQAPREACAAFLSPARISNGSGELFPRSGPSVRVQAEPESVRSAARIDWRELFLHPLEELAEKIVMRGVTGAEEIRRYALSALISTSGNQAILSFYENHMYLNLIDAREGSVTRVDGMVEQPSIVRDGNGLVHEGVHVRLQDLSDEAMARLQEIARDRRPYVNCAAAACTTLAAAGITLDPEGRRIPESTTEAVTTMLENGFFQDGRPIEVQVLTTTSIAPRAYLERASYLSGILASVRRFEIRGFLAVIRYASRSLAKWMFVASPSESPPVSPLSTWPHP